MEKRSLHWASLCLASILFLSYLRLIICVSNCPDTDAQCYCTIPVDNHRGDWEIDCPDAYRIVHNAQSYVSLECIPEAPYKKAMFTKLNVSKVTYFKFITCPLPNLTFQEVLLGMDVKKLKFESEAQNFSMDGTLLWGLDQLEELNLRNSQLISLSEDIFQNLTSLKRIGLDDNKLSSLPKAIFSGLENLVQLQLASNKLESLPLGVFSNLTKLQMLYLYNNRLAELPTGIFEGLHSLKILDLSNNRLQSVQSETFQGAPFLSHINLKGNSFHYFSEDLFQNVLNVIELDLSDNLNLTGLPEQLLQNLTQLQEIRLSSSRLSSIPKTFFSFSPKLTVIVLLNNVLGSLDPDLFEKNHALKELDIKYNSLTELDPNIFRKNSELKKLVFAFNHIEKLPAGIFDSLHSLTNLQLTGNSLQVLDGDLLQPLHKLEELYVDRNVIHTLQGNLPFGPSRTLKTVDISSNNLTSFPSHINWEIYLQLKKLSFKNNKINFLEVPNLLSHDVMVELQDNQIESIDVAEINLIDFVQANLSRNSFSRAEYYLEGNPINCDCRLWNFKKYFRDTTAKHSVKFTDVDTLKCSRPESTKGKEVTLLDNDDFICDIPRGCPEPCSCFYRAPDRVSFIECKNLTELPKSMPPNTTRVSIEYSQLGNLDSLGQKLWENVTVLLLNNNNLTADNWNLPSNLSALSLSGNSLSWLPESLIQYVNSRVNFQLHLGGNPWFCDCATLSMKEWIQENAKKIADQDKIYCENEIYQNGSSTTPLVIRLTNEICPESNEVQNGELITVSIICVVLAIMLFIVSVLYYRNKQTVTAYIYIHFYRVFVCFFNEEELDEDKTFDSFVSYSSADRDIAMSLINELEKGEPAFKLCIHERDWLPGNLISWNIVNSVQNSRKTILVLSKHFLESVWFQVEFHTAYYQMLEDRIDRLIVIVKGELPDKDSMDKDLQFLLSTKTYLVWGERWFWEKLRFALPHHKEGNPKTDKLALRNRPNTGLLKTVENKIASLNINGDSAIPPEVKVQNNNPMTNGDSASGRLSEGPLYDKELSVRNKGSTRKLDSLTETEIGQWPIPPSGQIESETGESINNPFSVVPV